MNQQEFSKLKIGDMVETIYKGQIVPMIIQSIYDEGRQKRTVNLNVPDSNIVILRHMYNIYTRREEKF